MHRDLRVAAVFGSGALASDSNQLIMPVIDIGHPNVEDLLCTGAVADNQGQ